MPESDEIDMIEAEPSNAQAEGYRTVYINTSSMGASPWDIRITLGSIIGNDSKSQVNQDQITILMSPQHAKAMIANLALTIATYEKNFGEITDIQKLLRENKAAKAAKAATERAAAAKPKKA